MSQRTSLVAAGSGVLFGAGLAVSGLTRPEVVQGFLDVTGRWDPTLGVVMAVAAAINAALVAVAMRRRRPLCAETLSLPATGRVDRRLLAGAAVFGVGWGLVGICPGPALTSLASGDPSVLAFVAAMTAGLVLTRVVATRARDGRRTNHKESAMLARFFVFAVTILLPGVAQAVTLATPLLQGDTALTCAVTNVGTQEASLASVEMFGATGMAVLADDYCGATLGPRQSCQLVEGGTRPLGFCQVTGSGKLRLTIIGYDAAGPMAALPGTAK